jgi:putative PEP-CTERM system histidine kinase
MESIVNSAPFAIAGVAHVILLVLLLASVRTSRIRSMLLFASASTAAAATALAIGFDNVLSTTGAIAELGATGSWCAVVIWLLYEQRLKRAYFAEIISLLALLSSVLIVSCAVFLALGAGGAISLAGTLEMYSRITLAVIGLLSTENFYRNSDAESRWNINFLCIALAGMFVYTIIVYADALLFHRVSTLLWAGRGIVIAFAAPLFAVAAARNRDWRIDIHVSRTAVFHTATLIGSGAFLLALAATGEIFRAIGPGWGDLAEVSVVIGGIAGAAVVVSSGSARSRLRRILADNFYSTRYDYRQEWLKSIEILSGGRKPDSVQTRVVKAIAEVADSPRGVLWVRDFEGSAFNWAGSWNQPAISMVEAAESAFIALFREGDWIVEFEDGVIRPDWLDQVVDHWIAVPLSDKGQLIGFVVLSRPRAPLKLDRESFDLLRIVARQAAVHVAEQRNAKALVESRELGDFAKRFAFVAHDMKNVSSQLAMILHNARSHGDDPQFNQDVLATVQAAHDRIRKLVTALRSNHERSVDGPILPIELLKEEVAAICRSRGHGVIDLRHDGRRAAVSMDAGAFRSVIAHLCDNAIDASAGQVHIRVRHEPMRVEIEVADPGSGMSAEFIRDQLFQPFGSTKRDGMGIGAYQARELVRAVGGDLLVTSQPGAGTTMRIMLPSLAMQPKTRPAQPDLEGIQ